MPTGPGVRFRFRKLKGGKKQRLAFRGNKVIEVTEFSKSGKKGRTRKLPFRTSNDST